jgi:hypothetical protein
MVELCIHFNFCFCISNHCLRISNKKRKSCIDSFIPSGPNFGPIYKGGQKTVEKACKTLLYVGLVDCEAASQVDDWREIVVSQGNTLYVFYTIVCNSHARSLAAYIAEKLQRADAGTLNQIIRKIDSESYLRVLRRHVNKIA